MRRLGQLPLIHQPGERWLYNTGYNILWVLIARVSGKPFRDWYPRSMMIWRSHRCCSIKACTKGNAFSRKHRSKR